MPAGEKATLQSVFAQHWSRYFARFGVAMPYAHKQAAEHILACRTPVRGMVRSRCAGCGCEHSAPLSCGHRACALCGTAQARAWSQRRSAKLLPVEHFLVTFTVPEALRMLLRAHQREGLAALFRASSEALRVVFKQHLQGEPGFTSVLHTWTRQLAYHPHIHSIVAGCASGENGAVRRLKKRDYLVPGAQLAAKFRDALRALLGKIPTLAKALAALPGGTWTRRWVVHIAPVGRGEKAMDYLARYVQKTALDSARIVASDQRGVTIAWRDRETKLARRTTLSGEEFLRRYLQHVLPSGFMRIRHGGFYAAAAKERYERLAALIGHIDNRPKPAAEPWKPTCEKCGGTMIVESLSIRGKTILTKAGRERILADLSAQKPATPTQERGP
jgi:hypothetical protein